MSDIQVPININADKVKQAMTIALQALGQQSFQVSEVVFGLAEAIGRTIVAQDMNPLAKAELSSYAHMHLVHTIKAGLEARGESNAMGLLQ